MRTRRLQRTSASQFCQPKGPRRRDILSFGLIAAGATGAGGYFLWPSLRQSFLTPTEAASVTVSMSGFSPNVIKARVGQTIDLQLINKDNSLHTDGGGWHQFAIDQLGLDFKVAPLSELPVSFVVQEPGEYDFYCGICCGGKANPYMHGQLVVEV